MPWYCYKCEKIVDPVVGVELSADVDYTYDSKDEELEDPIYKEEICEHDWTEYSYGDPRCDQCYDKAEFVDLVDLEEKPINVPENQLKLPFEEEENEII